MWGNSTTESQTHHPLIYIALAPLTPARDSSIQARVGCWIDNTLQDAPAFVSSVCVYRTLGIKYTLYVHYTGCLGGICVSGLF